VNDAPSFNVTDNSISVAEDSGAYNAAWATDISAGPGEKQNTTFSTVCDDAAAELFSVAPSVSATGVLTFTPAKDAFGISRCTVTLMEAGEGGLSAKAGLSIEVTAVNDPPSFTPGNATISVEGDSGAYSKAWASKMSAGPGEEQPLNMSIACAPSPLFTAAPTISAAGELSFTPAKTKSGSTTCTVTLAEAGADGLKATAPVTIVVTDGERAQGLGLDCVHDSCCLTCSSKLQPCKISCFMFEVQCCLCKLPLHATSADVAATAAYATAFAADVVVVFSLLLLLLLL
jgi:hypothetical protein